MLQKLRGHPKFIELLASAIAELPSEQVVAGLLHASDIGAFVIGQVFSQMDAAELQVLRAAFVFRGVFTFDALNAVHSMLDNEMQTIIPPVRALVRRAVLETMVGPPIGYYLHPILRDAVPREAEQEAAAHAAAAKWFLRRPVNPVDFTTWDDALYHLRRAAEVGRHGIYYDPYMEFMKDYTGSLEDAGWGRRVVAEDRVLDSLAQNDWEHFIARIDLGRRLKTLGELSEATQIFRELIEGIPKLPDDVPQEEEPEWLELITRGQIVAKDLLASTLAAANQLEEARRLVEEIEPVAELSQPSFDKLAVTAREHKSSCPRTTHFRAHSQ